MEEAQVTQQPKTRKIKVWQLILVILAGLVLLLSLTVVIWWSIIGVESFEAGVQEIVALFTPKENNVFYKDSYSVDAEKAKDKREVVVAKTGDAELTNGELQVYYWMGVYDFLSEYSYYAVYYGLDYTQPLDEQAYSQGEGTWQHFFLEKALNGWHNYKSMALLAEQEGTTLAEEMLEDLEALRASMTTTALEAGYSSIDAMLQDDMGPGCTYEDYYNYLYTYYMAHTYFSQCYDKIDQSEAALEAYFAAHEATLAESGITKDSGDLYDVRHILIAVEGTKDDDGNVTYTDEDWEACRAEAQALLDEWLAGEHTEETFAEYASEHSADTGSNTNGGLYEDLDADTSFVEEFVNWYMEEGRQVGDYGLIKTSYGYHIMYCSDIEAEWIAECRSALLQEEAGKIVEDATARYPMEVEYKKIVLGVVDLSTASE